MDPVCCDWLLPSNLLWLVIKISWLPSSAMMCARLCVPGPCQLCAAEPGQLSVQLGQH